MICENKPRVLITGVGGAAGVCALRSISPHATVFAGDMDSMASGLFLVPEAQRLTLSAAASPGFADELLALVKKLDIDVVLPTVDEELLPLADRRAEFEALGAVLMCSSSESLRVALDKYSFYQNVRELVPTPHTRLVSAPVAANEFPLISKPRVGRGSRGIELLTQPADLHALKERSASEFDTLLQDHLPGEEYSVDVLCDGPGRVLSAVPRWRARIRDGIATAGRTLYDEEMIAYATRIASTLGFDFVVNVQFKRDADGVPRVLEVNPRIPGTMALTVMAGVDMPLLALRLALKEPAHVQPFREVAMVRTFQETCISCEELMRSESAAPVGSKAASAGSSART